MALSTARVTTKIQSVCRAVARTDPIGLHSPFAHTVLRTITTGFCGRGIANKMYPSTNIVKNITNAKNFAMRGGMRILIEYI